MSINHEPIQYHQCLFLSAPEIQLVIEAEWEYWIYINN